MSHASLVFGSCSAPFDGINRLQPPSQVCLIVVMQDIKIQDEIFIVCCIRVIRQQFCLKWPRGGRHCASLKVCLPMDQIQELKGKDARLMERCKHYVDTERKQLDDIKTYFIAE